MKRISLVLNGLGADEDENQEEQEPKFTLGLKDIEKLIEERLAESNKNNQKEFLAALKTISKNNSSGDGQLDMLPVYEEDIDEEDYLQVPAVFFAFCVKTVIYDDVKFRRTIKVPYGRPIVFNTAIRTVAATNHKIPQYTSVCTAFIYSKKLAEFIRKHSLFGIMYFEKLNGMQVSADDADSLVRANQVVGRLDEHQLRARVINSGIKVTSSDPDELRKMLVKHIAEELKTADSNARKARLNEVEVQFGQKTDQESQVKTAPILT